jgi:hypothetical protein
VYTWVDGHTWYVQYLLNRLFALPEKTLSPELLDSLMMEILREEEYTYQTYFQLLTFNQAIESDRQGRDRPGGQCCRLHQKV